MLIDLDKPMTELTVREYAWLLAWQAQHVSATPFGVRAVMQANDAISGLKSAFELESVMRK